MPCQKALVEGWRKLMILEGQMSCSFACHNHLFLAGPGSALDLGQRSDQRGGSTLLPRRTSSARGSAGYSDCAHSRSLHEAGQCRAAPNVGGVSMPIVLPVRKEVAEIEARIANIRRAVENGFSDASWANARLRELVAEREARTARLDCPQLDSTTVMAYRRQTEKLLASVEPAERKRLIDAWVHNLELEPEKLAVRISYRLPRRGRYERRGCGRRI